MFGNLLVFPQHIVRRLSCVTSEKCVDFLCYRTELSLATWPKNSRTYKMNLLDFQILSWVECEFSNLAVRQVNLSQRIKPIFPDSFYYYLIHYYMVGIKVTSYFRDLVCL